MSPTNEDELIKIAFSCLKPNKSSGFDNIKPSILRRVIVFIVKPLSHIINCSLVSGNVPDDLKIAKVIPVYKKGDPSSYENYRPVSVLSCFSKIFERIVYNRIFTFISKYNIIFKGQYGFRPGHSTEHALTHVVNNLHKAFENKQTSVGVFLDLSKAFDTIDHQILLQKLYYYGIRGNALDWIGSYLFNRKQFTSFKDVNSDLVQIQCGVPQGSILGPLLFVLYVNDIGNVSQNCSVILFADDTNIFFTGHDMRELEILIGNELDKFHHWFSSNKLSLNIEKTNYIVFSNKRNVKNDICHISMNRRYLREADHVKFLGVYIDSNLTWKNHIQFIASTIAKSTGILSKLKHILPRNILRTLYLTLIYPQLTYCLTIWSGTCKTYLSNIMVLQKRAIRHISFASYNDHTSKLFSSLHLLKLQDLINLRVALFTYSSIHNILPVSLQNVFNYNLDVHTHNTRNAHNIHIPRCNSAFAKNNLLYRASITWNKLPLEVRYLPTIKSFKRNLTIILVHINFLK